MAGRRAAQCDGGRVPMSRGGEGEGPSVADRLADEIADAIMVGEQPLGTWPRQGHLAERFGVSRQPVREALRRLEIVGMIEARPASQRPGARLYPRRLPDPRMTRGPCSAASGRPLQPGATGYLMQGVGRNPGQPHRGVRPRRA